MLSKDDFVFHKTFGEGTVRSLDGDTVIVRFEEGLQECQLLELQRLEKLEEKFISRKQDSALAVLTRSIGACIRSINDEWGVFSSSRIKLFPHQLWVCKQVLTEWPSRWLVADDVGLGKTIEAGLILTSLLAAKKLSRVLIIAPASLAEQWQERMREMFDIRFSLYAAVNDKEKSDYWNTHPFVIVSMHTLRKDSNQRWERVTNADPWDLVIVDEAHHLNADEQTGKTLALRLLFEMEEKGCLKSLLLFTGTPHRGKDYGFMSLLQLLKPEEFSPQQEVEDIFSKLHTVMIRNNKQKTTDMDGNLIFPPVSTYKEVYSYSAKEAIFYERLTEFIVTGKAYANTLTHQQSRIVVFILTTMQKLASSSLAAIQKALLNRIKKLELGSIDSVAKNYDEFFQGHDDDDTLATVSETIIFEEMNAFRVLPSDEIIALKELVELAKQVEHETKLLKILDVIESKYKGQSILFFTEYKATQALFLSVLRKKYGYNSATFINGDGFLELINEDGERIKESSRRISAAEKFNSGKVRFLISTEAAGEGIDLQTCCSTLIHIDTPWNPMRLHQRVGRLSRLGQTKPVDVVLFYNEDTIEGKIFNCLEKKLERITLAFQGVMDDPEDMCSLVIGMASSSFMDSVYTDALLVKSENLEEWFNSQTATFGGQDAIDLTKKMFGSVNKFDFGKNVNALPKVDLEDLVPFMKLSLTYNGKRFQEYEVNRLSFQSPKKWMDDYRIFSDYQLVFSRSEPCDDDEDMGGIGLCIVNRAVEEAVNLSEAVTTIKSLNYPIFIFRLRDRLTGGSSTLLQSVIGAKLNEGKWEVLRDWELLLELNRLAQKPQSLQREAEMNTTFAFEEIEKAKHAVMEFLPQLNVPFRKPYIDEFACLLPYEEQ